MNKLSVSERLMIYTRYIGQRILLIDQNGIVDEQVGILTGIKDSGINVTIDKQSRWIPLYDHFEFYEIKLLLKPLSRLTEAIKQTANSLPIQNFITQYYIQLGFDMPVFIAPGHPANCKYVAELGLATYSTETELLKEELISA
ncbi:hypothetical protein [Rubrolithibacter danxiaensis]|uniref:hypothetical protein n=1 Tax=Rubrolithibacter danxiaensis TaxID=3390805 RepID=UPI003BF8A213